MKKRWLITLTTLLGIFVTSFPLQVSAFTLDIDGDDSYRPLSDGLMIIRHMFSFPGNQLTQGAIADTGDAIRSSSTEVTSFIDGAGTLLDIDGNGFVEPLADGILIIRYLFDFPGDFLIRGAIGSGATRTTAEEIRSYIETLVIPIASVQVVVAENSTETATSNIASIGVDTTTQESFIALRDPSTNKISSVIIENQAGEKIEFIFENGVVTNHKNLSGTQEPQETTVNTCEDIKGILEPWTVACNGNTAPSYYWKVTSKLREYGFYGLGHSTVEPTCDVTRVGSTAMTGSWRAETSGWSGVYEQYCWGNSPDGKVNLNADCSYSEGKSFSCKDPHCGIYLATCTRYEP